MIGSSLKPPQPTPKRLPERKAVTIVAGFRCPEGIVVCADTLETIGDISKRHVPKVRFERCEPERGDLAVAFCGATNNGPFLDEIVDRAWRGVQAATSLDQACDLINRSLKRSYEGFGRIYQRGYCPQAELIYGVKIEGKSRLFYSLGPAINERAGAASGGAGCYMADFIASRMYSGGLNLHQCVILAAYTLFQAKEYVAGCGGNSQVVVLRNKGVSGFVDSEIVNAAADAVQFTDRELGELALNSGWHSVSRINFQNWGEEIIRWIGEMREHQRLDLRKHRARAEKMAGFMAGKSVKLDQLGLLIPPKRKAKLSPPKERKASQSLGEIRRRTAEPSTQQ